MAFSLTGIAKNSCFFDNNATTKLAKSVENYLRCSYVNEFMNPSSQYLPAQKLLSNIEDDRQYVAEFIGVDSKNIFFTSGATESINTFLNPLFCQEHLISTIISSHLEHEVVDRCLARLIKYGINVLYVKHDRNGVIDSDHLATLTKNNPRALVTLLGANNETGVLQDIAALAKISKEHDCLVHLDGVSMLGRLPIELSMLDFASFSAHKIGGMKGVGFSYIDDPALVTPLIVGGDQQDNLRAGTYNNCGIKTLRLALEDSTNWDLSKTKSLRDTFESDIKKLNNDIIINCQDVARLVNTTNIFFPTISGYALLMELASREIYVSLGSACHGAHPSRIIQQLGYNRDYAESCLRFSFADFNDEQQKDYALEIIAEII